MKKDIEIQKDVIEHLNSIPSLNASEIGVSVKNGIVTLSGIVNSYPRKIAIERAVLKVKNVHGVAEDLQVKLNAADKKTDSEIAQAALYAIEWHSGLDPDKIKILVEDGVVTIDGIVDWDYQRKLAQKTVNNILGVKGVINNIKLAPKPLSGQIKDKIKNAFLRSANIDAAKIDVELEGNTVVLKGKVKSWSEKKEAENTVWTLPGITSVDNELEYEESFDTSEVL